MKQPPPARVVPPSGPPISPQSPPGSGSNSQEEEEPSSTHIHHSGSHRHSIVEDTAAAAAASLLLQQLRTLLSAASQLQPLQPPNCQQQQQIPQLDHVTSDHSAIAATATLQDFMSASDEKGGIERLVDELCAKLKAIQTEGGGVVMGGVGMGGGGGEMPQEPPPAPPLANPAEKAANMECLCYVSTSSSVSSSSDAVNEVGGTVEAPERERKDGDGAEDNQEESEDGRVPFYRVVGGESSEDEEDDDGGSSQQRMASDESEGYHGDLSSRDSSEDEGGGGDGGLVPRLRLYERKGSWASSTYSPPSRLQHGEEEEDVEEEEEEEEEEGEGDEGGGVEDDPTLAQLIAKFNEEVAALWPPSPAPAMVAGMGGTPTPPLHVALDPALPQSHTQFSSTPTTVFISAGTNLTASIWSAFLPGPGGHLVNGRVGALGGGQVASQVGSFTAGHIGAIPGGHLWAHNGGHIEIQVDEGNSVGSPDGLVGESSGSHVVNGNLEAKQVEHLKAIWSQLDNNNWAPYGEQMEQDRSEEEELELEGLLESFGTAGKTAAVIEEVALQSGAYAPLNFRRETSSFVVVVPGQRNVGVNYQYHHYQYQHRRGQQKRKGGKGGGKAPNPNPEDENLLTSPRTHFKPIGVGRKPGRREDGGDVDGDDFGGGNYYEDGSTFHLAPPRHSSVQFVRSPSGCLCQTGVASPRPRYLVYKCDLPGAAAALQPKFKLRRQNEKGCQTEESGIPAVVEEKVQPVMGVWPDSDSTNDQCGQTLRQLLAQVRQVSEMETPPVGTSQAWGQRFSCSNDSPNVPWQGWWGVHKLEEDATPPMPLPSSSATTDCRRQLREEISAESEQLLADIDQWQRLGALGGWGSVDGEEEEEEDDTQLCPPPEILLPMDLVDQHLLEEMFGAVQRIQSGEGADGDMQFGGEEGEEEWVRKVLAARSWMAIQAPAGRHRSRRRSGKQAADVAAAAAGGKKRPCSFFLEGNCRRSDCKFSHDLGSITCRFWEAAACLKGAACPFMHGYPDDRDVGDSSESRQFELQSESDFPSLAPAPSSPLSFPILSAAPPPHGMPPSSQSDVASGPNQGAPTCMPPRRKRFRSSKSASSASILSFGAYYQPSRGDGACSAPAKGDRRTGITEFRVNP